ncbi:uncharacterized protein LOC129896381 [Solanum dulcamara]|uniref:uncharacterized protein LOC129896381 n=1 Tax=Solanum dulcamara TaxID=45834 RepID=UPI0024865272|nr:uncharacterized protein LOC129896381 [Solanum dulcamara]
MVSTNTMDDVEKQRNHPLHLLNSDTPGIPLTTNLLTGVENYTIWSRSVLLNLRAKSKIGFVKGTCKKSDYSSDLEEQWEKCNAFVLSWIVHSVSKDLMNGIMYASNAATVWADLKERFDKVDGSRGYQLHREICTIAQGTSSVSAYFTSLRLLWAEFDALIAPPSCGCPNSREYVGHLEYTRLYAFLMELNESYNQARSQILIMIPLPSVKKAYSMIMADESQKIIAGSYSGGDMGESSSTALYASKGKGHVNEHQLANSYGAKNAGNAGMTHAYMNEPSIAALYAGKPAFYN